MWETSGSSLCERRSTIIVFLLGGQDAGASAVGAVHVDVGVYRDDVEAPPFAERAAGTHVGSVGRGFCSQRASVAQRIVRMIVVPFTSSTTATMMRPRTHSHDSCRGDHSTFSGYYSASAISTPCSPAWRVISSNRRSEERRVGRERRR